MTELLATLRDHTEGGPRPRSWAPTPSQQEDSPAPCSWAVRPVSHKCCPISVTTWPWVLTAVKGTFQLGKQATQPQVRNLSESSLTLPRTFLPLPFSHLLGGTERWSRQEAHFSVPSAPPLIIYPSPKLHPTHMHFTGLNGKFYCQATLASYWAELALVNDPAPSILSTWDPAASTALAQVTKAPALSPTFQRVPLWPVSCCISLHESGVDQVGSVPGSLVSTPN